jgi:hypothetical protein
MGTSQISPSANWRKELLCWFKVLFSLLVIWWVLAMLPGCRRPAEALGTVWMDGLKIGCGVLVGIPDGNRTHIAFLTARHVATANGFFRMPSERNAVYLNSGGAFRYHRIGNIAPERWFCSKHKDLDLAWFVLTPEEVGRISCAGKLPPYVMIGEHINDNDPSMVAIFDRQRMNSIIEGDRISVARAGDMPSLSIPITVLFAWTESATILKRWQECVVELPLNLFMRKMTVRQSVIDMSVSQSDSGTPVFSCEESGRPYFLGLLITGKLNQELSGFLPIQAVDDIKESIVTGNGVRLIERKDFW